MKVGDKVKIVGRFDVRQKPDKVKFDGEVFKITPKRIYVRETSWSVFVFDKASKKEIGGNWKLRKKQ